MRGEEGRTLMGKLMEWEGVWSQLPWAPPPAPTLAPPPSPAPWLVAAHPSHCIQWVYEGGTERIPLFKVASCSKMQMSRFYLLGSLILQVLWQQEEFGCVWNHQQHYLELGPSPIFPNNKIIKRWKIKELIPQVKPNPSLWEENWASETISRASS